MRPWQLLAMHAKQHIYQKRSTFSLTVPLTWRSQSLEHLVTCSNKRLCLTITVPVLPKLLLSNSPVEREADQQGPSVMCTCCWLSLVYVVWSVIQISICFQRSPGRTKSNIGGECSILKITMNLHYILFLKVCYLRYNLGYCKEPTQIVKRYPLPIHLGKGF